MDSLDALILCALVVVILIITMWFCRRHKNKASTFLTGGPYNIGLNDETYHHYPYYAGQAETRWDGDRRCVAYCEQEPCTIWCR
jgi:hypothetical protein